VPVNAAALRTGDSFGFGADVPQALGELLDELNDVGFEDEVEIEKELVVFEALVESASGLIEVASSCLGNPPFITYARMSWVRPSMSSSRFMILY